MTSREGVSDYPECKQPRIPIDIVGCFAKSLVRHVDNYLDH